MSAGPDYVAELRALTDLLFIPHVIHECGEPWWDDIDSGNRRTRRKTCLNATLCTTNPTWTGPGANSALRGEMSATNRLSHGTALCVWTNVSLVDNNRMKSCSRLTDWYLISIMRVVSSNISPRTEILPRSKRYQVSRESSQFNLEEEALSRSRRIKFHWLPGCWELDKNPDMYWMVVWWSPVCSGRMYAAIVYSGHDLCLVLTWVRVILRL
jgi:hypothetical protein